MSHTKKMQPSQCVKRTLTPTNIHQCSTDKLSSQSTNQSIKTHLHCAIRHELLRGT